MTLPIARRGQILADLAVMQAVEVDDLTQRYGVSTSTIRRDLDVLAHLGQLTRVHGGALALGFAEFDRPATEPSEVPELQQVSTESSDVSHRAAG